MVKTKLIQTEKEIKLSIKDMTGDERIAYYKGYRDAIRKARDVFNDQLGETYYGR